MRNIVNGGIIAAILTANERGGGGNTARQMAAAPLASAAPATPEVTPGNAPTIEVDAKELAELDATEPAVEEGNPYDRLFESVVFSAAEGGQIYTRDGDGQKSKKIGNFLAQVRNVPVSITGTIYARLPKGAKDAFVDVAFIGTQRANALKPHDEASKLHLAAWKVRTAGQFAAWLKTQKITAVTAQSVVMPKIEGINFDEAAQQ